MKTNGLVGAKKQGKGPANLRKKEKKWISRGLKEEARRTNLREKENTNGLVGAKNRGWGEAA